MNIKKISSFLTIIVGIILIIISSFLWFNNDEKEPDIDSNFGIKINTEIKDGVLPENSNYPYYNTSNFDYSYVKDVNLFRKNKYVFPYPVELSSTYDSEFYRIFKSDDLVVSSNYYVGFNIDDYISNLKEEYESYSYSEFYHSEVKDIELFGYKANYFKIQAYSTLDNIEGSFGNNKYFENFVIVIHADDEVSMVMSYVALSKKFSDDFLTNIVNKIKIEENAASYLSSKEENGFLVGTLSLRDIYKSDLVHKVNYKIDASKFHEAEDIRNDYDTLILYSSDNSVFVLVELLQNNLDSIDLVIEDYLKNYFAGHELLNYSVDSTIYNNHQYKVVSFNPKRDNESELYYYKQFFEKVDENTYIVISSSASSKIENDEIIKHFEY